MHLVMSMPFWGVLRCHSMNWLVGSNQKKCSLRHQNAKVSTSVVLLGYYCELLLSSCISSLVLFLCLACMWCCPPAVLKHLALHFRFWEVVLSKPCCVYASLSYLEHRQKDVHVLGCAWECLDALALV